VNDLRDDGAEEAVAGLVAFLVHVQERVEMPREALPEWRLPGAARTIDLPFGHELRAEWLHHAAQCRKSLSQQRAVYDRGGEREHRKAGK
jgi:hypothetical protein